MRIITIDREFGSGGRELGKRLADALEIPCYDQEIIEEVAKLHGLDPSHVERISETDIRTVYPMTIGRRFRIIPTMPQDTIQVLASQKGVIKKLAQKGDCVIVGRCADLILQDMKPFNIFVYADQQSRLQRCMQRADRKESRQELQHLMRKIDQDRKACRELLADSKWGEKETYHLCINTSGQEIKGLIPAIVTYVNCWFSA